MLNSAVERGDDSSQCVSSSFKYRKWESAYARLGRA